MLEAAGAGDAAVGHDAGVVADDAVVAVVQVVGVAVVAHGVLGAPRLCEEWSRWAGQALWLVRLLLSSLFAQVEMIQERMEGWWPHPLILFLPVT